MKLANLSASASADAVTARLNGGKLRFYTGAAPANADDAATGTLLAEAAFPNPAFNAASNGVAAMASAISDASVDASGTIGYALGLTSVDAPVCIFTVGTSGADIVLNNLSVTAGGSLAINSLTYTQPKG